MLFMGLPGGYLLVDAKIDTNVEWLADFGTANRWSVRWLEQRGGSPDTVFIAADYPRQAGSWAVLRWRDPLVNYVLRNYQLVGRAGEMFVFTRKQ